MVVKTGRFGQLTIDESEVIRIPQGVLGFPEVTRYCLVDPGDDTLVLWLQSLDKPEVAFPVLEPKIFKLDYIVKLSGAELRELKLDRIDQSAVFSILTIPGDISQMTANLKAPLVINLKDRVAKQVVLQENEYGVKHAMFKELRAHLVTLASQRQQQAEKAAARESHAIKIQELQASDQIRSLQAH